MTVRRPRWLLSLLTLALLSATVVAWSYWSVPGIGSASAATANLAAATITAPAAATNAVTVTWIAQASLQPTSAANSAITYAVQRRLGAGSYAAVSTGGCSGAKPYGTSSCTDVPPATGTYTYRVVATFHSWTATSADPGAVSFLLDTTAPTVQSLVRVDAATTNSASVHWTATFSESVTGVGAADFTLVRTGGLTGGSITNVTGSGTTYAVTASTGSGDGTLGLDLVDDDTIADVAANPLGGSGAGNGKSTGELYTVDRTAPALTELKTLDTNANGKVDRITATFGETLAASTPTAPWTLVNVPSGGTLVSVSTSGQVATLVISEGAGATDTTVSGAPTVALAASADGIRDAAGNQSSFAATAPVDGAAPLRTDMRMLDVNANGKVDRVAVTFGETLATSTLTSQWTLTAVPSGGTLASVSTSGLVATLVLSEGAGAADTAVGSFTVALTAAASGIRDASGNQSSFSASAPTDVAAPVVTPLEMLDIDTDGKVDRVVATFSELLASSTSTGQWTLSGVPSGGALASVSTSGSVATLTLTEGAGAANTAATGFTLALAASAMRDAIGNQGTFGATAPADKARPVPVTVADHNAGVLGLGEGQLGSGDWLAATFSEAIAPASITSATTITMSKPSANVLLTIPGFTNGALDTGSGSYLQLGDFITFHADAALSGSSKILTVTADNCSSGCLANLLGGSAGLGMSYVPAPGLTDGAGNPAAGSFHTTFALF